MWGIPDLTSNKDKRGEKGGCLSKKKKFNSIVWTGYYMIGIAFIRWVTAGTSRLNHEVDLKLIPHRQEFFSGARAER